jgi:hypothetical protein
MRLTGVNNKVRVSNQAVFMDIPRMATGYPSYAIRFSRFVGKPEQQRRGSLLVDVLEGGKDALIRIHHHRARASIAARTRPASESKTVCRGRGQAYIRSPGSCTPAATMLAGAAFLRSVIAAFPYKLHTVLTDNGTPFADQPRYRSGPTARYRLPPGRFSL